MAEIQAICQRHRLALIEDACHAVGAPYRDAPGRAKLIKMAGTVGDAGCFSFFSNKNLVTGEGGMVVTDRDDLAARLRLLRSHGMTTLTWDRHQGHASSYEVVTHGYNYRLDEVRAALGRCQLRKLQENNARRQYLVKTYREHLQGHSGWTIPFAGYAGESANHLMVAVAPDERTRGRVVGVLREAAIQTSLHYPCIPDFKVFAGLGEVHVPRSRAFQQRAITLPLFPTMTAGQVAEVCAVIGAAAVQGPRS
jgi:dTDP-4-amino-4,6-dideoxygalactose transaminase